MVAVAPPGGRARHWTAGRFRPIGAATILSLGMLCVLAAAAVAGPSLWSEDPNRTNLLNRFAGPSSDHPLGTDQFGRDLLARLLSGARLSLLGAAAVVFGSTALGLVVGGLAGVVGGILDRVASRLIDALLALPSLIIAIAIVGVLGPSFPNVVLALVATGWPWYARLYRAFALREREQEYILAARSTGSSIGRIAWRHIGPNVFGPAMVVSTANLGNAVLGLASLSFLGLGVQPPEAEWGAMVSEARSYFQVHPWLIVAPGGAISVTVVAVNVIGDSLRDRVHRRGGVRNA